MSRNISTKIELAGEAEFKAAVKEINSELGVLKSEMAVCDSEFQGQANSLEALTKKHELLGKQVNAQTRKLEELKKKQAEANRIHDETAGALEKARAEYGEGSEAVKRLSEKLSNAKEVQAQYNRQVNYAQADLNKMQRELNKTAQYMEEAETSADGCAVSIDAFGKAAKNAGEQLQSAGGQMQSAGGQMQSVGDLLQSVVGQLQSAGEQSGVMGEIASLAMNKIATAITVTGALALVGKMAAAMNVCANAAAEFETGMAKVQTLAGKDAMRGMRDEILAVSSAMGVAARDVAEAVYSAISGGVRTGSAVDFTATALKLAKGGFTDAATAVDVLTTAINAYGLSAEEAATVSDRLIATQNLGKTTVDELAGSLGRVIPTAAAFNVDLDNLSAAMARLTAGGLDTNQATTYLNAMLQELGNSGSDVSEILQGKTGKAFAELMDEGHSLGDVIGILSGAVNDNATAFNNLWSSQTASTAALSLAKTGAEQYNETLAAMAESTGAAEDAFETMADTAEETEARLAVAWENFKIVVGDKFVPVKQAVMEQLIMFLEAGKRGKEYLQSLGDVSNAAQTFVGEIRNLEEAGSENFNQLAIYYRSLLQELNTPFEWDQYDKLSDAVAAAAVAAREAAPELFGLAESMEALADASAAEAEAADAAADALAKSLSALIDDYNAVYDAAYSSISGQLGLFDEVAAESKITVEDMMSALDSQVSYLDTYAEDIQKAMELGVDKGIVEKLSDGSEESAAILHEIVTNGGDMIDELNDKFAAVEEGKKAFSNAVGAMKISLDEAAAGMVADFEQAVRDLDMYEEAHQAGIDTVQGYIDGARAKAYIDGTREFSDIADAFMTAFKTPLVIASPSRAMRRLGVFTVEGLIEGVRSERGEVEDAAGDIASLIESAFRASVGGFSALGVADTIEASADKAAKAADTLARNVYSKSKEWADRQTKQQELSLREQLALWEAIQRQFISESKQYADAEEKIFDLRQKIQDEYYAKVKEINENITSLEKTYQDTLANRTKEIFNSYKLFDQIPERQRVSGNALIKNLKGQIATIEEFYGGLNELAERGVGDDLVAEIRAMGPGAVNELSALLALSDEKLSEYAALYGEKQALANSIAVEELSRLREETDRQVMENLDALGTLYEENAPDVGRALTDGLAEGILGGMPSVVSAAESTAQAALDAVRAVFPGFDAVEAARVVSQSMAELNSASAAAQQASDRSSSEPPLSTLFANAVNGIQTAVAGIGDGMSLTVNVVAEDGTLLGRSFVSNLFAAARSYGMPIQTTL